MLCYSLSMKSHSFIAVSVLLFSLSLWTGTDCQISILDVSSTTLVSTSFSYAISTVGYGEPSNLNNMGLINAPASTLIQCVNLILTNGSLPYLSVFEDYYFYYNYNTLQCYYMNSLVVYNDIHPYTYTEWESLVNNAGYYWFHLSNITYYGTLSDELYGLYTPSLYNGLECLYCSSGIFSDTYVYLANSLSAANSVVQIDGPEADVSQFTSFFSYGSFPFDYGVFNPSAPAQAAIFFPYQDCTGLLSVIPCEGVNGTNTVLSSFAPYSSFGGTALALYRPLCTGILEVWEPAEEQISDCKYDPCTYYQQHNISTCENNGVCVNSGVYNSLPGFTCTCAANFTSASNCTACSPGFTGSLCDWNPCGVYGVNCNNGTCHNGVVGSSPGWSCICNSIGWSVASNCSTCSTGYSGENCGVVTAFPLTTFLPQTYDFAVWFIAPFGVSETTSLGGGASIIQCINEIMYTECGSSADTCDAYFVWKANTCSESSYYQNYPTYIGPNPYGGYGFIGQDYSTTVSQTYLITTLNTNFFEYATTKDHTPLPYQCIVIENNCTAPSNSHWLMTSSIQACSIAMQLYNTDQSQSLSPDFFSYGLHPAFNGTVVCGFWSRDAFAHCLNSATLGTVTNEYGYRVTPCNSNGVNPNNTEIYSGVVPGGSRHVNLYTPLCPQYELYDGTQASRYATYYGHSSVYCYFNPCGWATVNSVTLCLNGANCTNTDYEVYAPGYYANYEEVANYTCACAPGFTTFNCSTWDPCVYYDISNPCANGGQCLSTTVAPFVNWCTCAENFTAASNCTACSAGYTGSQCDWNPCGYYSANAICGSGYECINSVWNSVGANHTCVWNPCTYYGVECTNGGSCTTGPTGSSPGWNCSCAQNFTSSSNCSVCTPGYFGPSCIWEPCSAYGVNSVCSNGGVCESGPVESSPGWSCSCAGNYSSASNCTECIFGYYGVDCLSYVNPYISLIPQSYDFAIWYKVDYCATGAVSFTGSATLIACVNSVLAAGPYTLEPCLFDQRIDCYTAFDWESEVCTSAGAEDPYPSCQLIYSGPLYPTSYGYNPSALTTYVIEPVSTSWFQGYDETPYSALAYGCVSLTAGCGLGGSYIWALVSSLSACSNLSQVAVGNGEYLAVFSYGAHPVMNSTSVCGIWQPDNIQNCAAPGSFSYRIIPCNSQGVNTIQTDISGTVSSGGSDSVSLYIPLCEEFHVFYGLHGYGYVIYNGHYLANDTFSCYYDPCNWATVNSETLCLNGGICDDTSYEDLTYSYNGQNYYQEEISGYTCICPFGYTGYNCAIWDPCMEYNFTCAHGGSCVNESPGSSPGWSCACSSNFTSSSNCTACAVGYTGSHCVWNPCSAFDISCGLTGSCVNGAVGSSPGWSCTCPSNFTVSSNCTTCSPGYTGVGCNWNPCSAFEITGCANGGACVNGAVASSPGWSCSCENGYTGTNCTAWNPCSVFDISCGVSGSCINGAVGSSPGWNCSCPENFTSSSNCTVCSPGYTGPQCDWNPCGYYGEAVLCQGNYQCVNSVQNPIGANYTCTCPSNFTATSNCTACSPGFTGSQCDWNPCGFSNPCQNNGTCIDNTTVDGIPQSTCNCTEQWTGEDCQVLVTTTTTTTSTAPPTTTAVTLNSTATASSPTWTTDDMIITGVVVSVGGFLVLAAVAAWYSSSAAAAASAAGAAGYTGPSQLISRGAQTQANWY